MEVKLYFRKEDVLPEKELPDDGEIIARGRLLANNWAVQTCEFLKAHNCASEREYKVRQMELGKVMQHAHMGFRDVGKSERAFSEIYESVLKNGVEIDRYGICLDWSMGFPRDIRDQQIQGTGVILRDAEAFSRLTNQAPVASHFGDFMLGFPAALENTQSALSAGVTTIGNLGQYFTFELPNWKDDVETTRSTLTAIALMAAQPVDVLIHSNLDDGFAGVLGDLCCALGAAALECYLVTDLLGGKITHCYGHHYSTPELRYAFQLALSEISPQPGSMIYGNTTSYRGTPAQNYASLSGYLMVDIAAQIRNPSGHAINPVPVTENQRIPDISEIIDAQNFAAQLIDITRGFDSIVDMDTVQKIRTQLVEGAKIFKSNLLSGFEEAGIDVTNPVEMFLAIRRIGGKKLEQWYGPGALDPVTGLRVPIVSSDTQREITEAAQYHIGQLADHGASQLRGNKLRVVIATTDVHEHSKLMLEQILIGLGIDIVDGGISVDPDDLAEIVEYSQADAVALSTYNGIALAYYGQLKDELEERGICLPVMIGGQLNQIPKDTDTSLPEDVSPELKRLGAIPCRSVQDMMPCLLELVASTDS